jgi:hypothetical protein
MRNHINTLEEQIHAKDIQVSVFFFASSILHIILLLYQSENSSHILVCIIHDGIHAIHPCLHHSSIVFAVSATTSN